MSQFYTSIGKLVAMVSTFVFLPILLVSVVLLLGYIARSLYSALKYQRWKKEHYKNEWLYYIKHTKEINDAIRHLDGSSQEDQ